MWPWYYLQRRISTGAKFHTEEGAENCRRIPACKWQCEWRYWGHKQRRGKMIATISLSPPAASQLQLIWLSSVHQTAAPCSSSHREAFHTKMEMKHKRRDRGMDGADGVDGWWQDFWLISAGCLMRLSVIITLMFGDRKLQFLTKTISRYFMCVKVEMNIS